MNIEIIVLRLFHIVPGVFWVGTVLFSALILRPRLRSQDFGANHSLTHSLDRAINASTGIAGVITVAAGVGLALRLRWGHLDSFFDTAWGFAILVGFVAAMGAFALGAMEARALAAIDRLSGDESDSARDSTAQALDRRIVFLGRMHALLVLVAVGAMASARFV